MPSRWMNAKAIVMATMTARYVILLHAYAYEVIFILNPNIILLLSCPLLLILRTVFIATNATAQSLYPAVRGRASVAKTIVMILR